MNSINSSDKILSIRNLSVNVNQDIYPRYTVKDIFISSVQSLVQKKNTKKTINILANINLDIFRGQRVGIIGVNGAGKSSLCRCISGVCSTDKNTIMINGKARFVLNSNAGIFPELTGRENAELLSYLMYPDLSIKERREMLQESLDFSELKDFLDSPFNTYSKGMQTRLILSMISAKSCDLLILDEVFDGADEFFQSKISKRILNTIFNSGAAIFVTHSIPQLRLVCNRLIVLNEGQIAFDGSIDDGVLFYRSIKK